MGDRITTVQYMITFYKVTASTIGIVKPCRTVIGFQRRYPYVGVVESKCDNASSTFVFPTIGNPSIYTF